MTLAEQRELVDWRVVDESVQDILAGMDDRVLAALPGATVRRGANEGGCWLLFSYRVYDPPRGAEIDPVVVGVNFAPSRHGIVIHGDIAGEMLGDVLLDLPSREAENSSAVMTVARDTAEGLRQHADIVIIALRNLSRASLE